MANLQQLDFDTLERALVCADAAADAADSHGFLCGLICSTGFADPRIWTAELLGEQPPDEEAAEEAARLLQALYEDTQARINSPDMDFHLMLPDERFPLPDRVESLGQWCHGFMSGLGVGGVPDQGKLSEDAGELLKDLAEIARVDFDMDKPDEEDESAFAEIVEFVRVGVLLLNEELQPAKPPTQLQ